MQSRKQSRFVYKRVYFAACTPGSQESKLGVLSSLPEYSHAYPLVVIAVCPIPTPRVATYQKYQAAVIRSPLVIHLSRVFTFYTNLTGS